MRARVAILASTAMAVAGCAHTVTGAPVFTAAEPITPLRPDDTGQVLVTADQLAAAGAAPDFASPYADIATFAGGRFLPFL